MPELKSNVKTGSIFCDDCGYLDGKTLKCNQFNERLRTFRDQAANVPVKGKLCIKFGFKQY